MRLYASINGSAVWESWPFLLSSNLLSCQWLHAQSSGWGMVWRVVWALPFRYCENDQWASYSIFQSNPILQYLFYSSCIFSKLVCCHLLTILMIFHFKCMGKDWQWPNDNHFILHQSSLTFFLSSKISQNKNQHLSWLPGNRVIILSFIGTRIYETYPKLSHVYCF